MESEKSKRKRNKKKKSNNNGQNKASDEVSENQSQASTEVKNVENHEKESDIVCLSGNGVNGSDSTNLAESEKQLWLQKEAVLEETIRQLQAEKDIHIEKEATLEGNVNQLRLENILHLRKEFSFEETIKQLQGDNDSYVQKEANLEMKIGQLQSEKESWLQKASHLDERIRQLVDEKITWNLKEESLEDRIKHLEVENHSLILKEDSTRAMIDKLGYDIAALQTQVLELEETRNNLLKENRQLTENVSSLQMQIKNIESKASTQSPSDLIKLTSERDELSSQVEAAFALVERLMEENAELVEKVSELLIQHDHHRGSDSRSSTLTPESIPRAIETTTFSNPGSEFNDYTPKTGHKSNSNSIEIISIKEEINGVNNTGKSDHLSDAIPVSLTSEVSGEIVQIPLDESNISDLESQVEDTTGDEAVPFTDSPLIGAPFRLISFVSRYVSGADLVDRNSLQV